MEPLYPTKGHQFIGHLKGPAKGGHALPTSHLGVLYIHGPGGRKVQNPNRPEKPAGFKPRIDVVRDKRQGVAVRHQRPGGGRAMMFPPHFVHPAANPATTVGPHHPSVAGHPAFTSGHPQSLSLRPRNHAEAIHSPAMPHLIAHAEGFAAGPMGIEAKRLIGEAPPTSLRRG